MTQIQLVTETNRYLSNGKEILKKARKRGDFYQDSKYTKIAGHTLYSAMLLALDDIMPIAKKERNTVVEYRNFLTKKNKKTLNKFNSAYYILHQSMGYDGIVDYIVIKRGIENAKDVIKWAIESKNSI